MGVDKNIKNIKNKKGIILKFLIMAVLHVPTFRVSYLLLLLLFPLRADPPLYLLTFRHMPPAAL